MIPGVDASHMALKPEILRPTGAGNLVLVCDHASNRVPAEYGDLGLAKPYWQEHIAWDIGAAGITRALSGALDAPAVLAAVSRLLIDTNRALDAPSLILARSDGTDIPGNRNLKARERRRRIHDFYQPFHAAVDVLVKTRLARRPYLVGIHTFTPVFGGKSRGLEFAVLWNEDDRLAKRLGTAFEAHGFKVGWNEPYSGKDFFETQNRHGRGNGLPHVTIEVRQDLVADEAGQAKFAALIADALSEIRLKGF